MCWVFLTLTFVLISMTLTCAQAFPTSTYVQVFPKLDLCASLSNLVLFAGFGVPDCMQVFLTLTCVQEFLH
jgi:hypothetical protein